MGVDEILIKQAVQKVENENHSKLKIAVLNLQKEGFSMAKIANILSLTESEVEAYFKELDSDVKKQN